MKNLRVAAYCRVSTDKEEQLHSLDSQRYYFSEYIKNHPNWSFVNIFYDEGMSGTQTMKRVGFHQMVDEALQGKIDLILTKEVSRFARNTVDTLSYTRKLKEYGVGVIFTLDNINTLESDGELRLTIMASIAQEESRKTSERVKWGQKRRMEQGVVFGRELLGYYVKNGTLTINEEEAEIVRAIFHKYTNEGKGTHTISRELIEEGMYPKRIALWSNTVLLRILRNEKYVGDLCQKKTITPNYLTHKKKYNHGEEELIYISHHHEPIIERKLWERTQEELQKRSTSVVTKEKYSNRYWCSGKLYCGICGRRFISRTKKCKDGSVYKAWCCFTTARHGKRKPDADEEYVGCKNQSYNEKSLLTVVHYALGILLSSQRSDLEKEIIEEIRKIQKESEENRYGSKISQVKEQIEIYHEKKCKVMDLLLSDLIDMKEVKKQHAWYDKKIEELEKQLFQLSKTEELQKEYLFVLDEIMNFSCDINYIEKKFYELQYDGKYHIIKEKNEVLKKYIVPEQLYRKVIDKIVLYPEGKLQVFLKGVRFVVEMKIRTSGRKEAYTTEILEIKIINE